MSGVGLERDLWDEDENGSTYSNFTPSNNVTLTCAARSLIRPGELPFSPALTTTVRSFQTFFYILYLFLGIFLNTLVVLLVAKYKKLRTRSFAIALQVVVSNLIVLLFVYMARPVTAIANKWLFGEYMCIITAFIFVTWVLLRSSLMFAFVVDRFLSVFYPFSYPLIM